MSRDDEIQVLLHRVERDPGNGLLANELLREFHRGYPVENLRVLTSSDDEEVVKTGVWLASELGARCRSILSDIETLLGHPCANIRYFAIDCILSASRRGDGGLVARVLRLMEDESAAVRRKAMDFATRIPLERLSEALAAVGSSGFGTDHIAGIELVISSPISPENIEAFLRSDNRVRRRYGAIAAARVVKSLPQAFELALRSYDDDLRTFASDVIALARPRNP